VRLAAAAAALAALAAVGAVSLLPGLLVVVVVVVVLCTVAVVLLLLTDLLPAFAMEGRAGTGVEEGAARERRSATLFCALKAPFLTLAVVEEGWSFAEADRPLDAVATRAVTEPATTAGLRAVADVDVVPLSVGLVRTVRITLGPCVAVINALEAVVGMVRGAR